MKTVMIEGKEYEVPDEAIYRAMDADGEWWWYDLTPVPNYDNNCWWPDYSQCIQCQKGFICRSTHWDATLTKIE